MLREIGHFLGGAPTIMRLKSRLPQAELYDTLMEGAETAGMAGWRRALAEGLSGEVLEIGAGTGLMFPYYRPGLQVRAIEPDREFIDRARPRAAVAPARIDVVEGSVESIPFPDHSFDRVVVSLVLCSVPSVPTALCEISRVLRPSGEVRLIEHVRSTGFAGVLMDLFDPLWLRMNGQGCHMNRRTESLLTEGGFHIDEVRPFQVFTKGLPAFPMRWLRASVGRRAALH